MGALIRNNVKVSGSASARPVMFAHGFGCDQTMWRLVAPHFEADHQVVLFDHLGFGGSDATAFDPAVYSSLDAFASDVLEILEELDLTDVVFVGHSVSAMIGVLAALAPCSRISALVLVGPSPCYVTDDEYVGGFSRADIDELLVTLDSNYLGWSATMAPIIMGNPDRSELSNELFESFCRVDPAIARSFARVTFLSDNRHDLSRVDVPTLIIQCSEDSIAPIVVGKYVRDQIRHSEMHVIDISGHCPQLSAPDQTVNVIQEFVERLPSTV